ncbi:MAG: hypothetical protein Q9170_005171 [Blastenia crenularia]
MLACRQRENGEPVSADTELVPWAKRMGRKKKRAARLKGILRIRGCEGEGFDGVADREPGLLNAGTGKDEGKAVGVKDGTRRLRGEGIMI